MKKRYLSVAIGLIIVVAIAIFGNICKIQKVEVAFSKAPVSTSTVEVYESTKIEMGDSILNLNENLIKQNVANTYEGNSVMVTDVVRVFPNKVVIYCMENLPMVAVKVKGESEVYAVTDGNFQLNKKVAKSELDLEGLILIEGIEVTNTYNTEGFKTINKVFKAFEGQGLDFNAQAKFFKKLIKGENTVTLETRDGCVLTLNTTGDLSLEAQKAYTNYLSGV